MLQKRCAYVSVESRYHLFAVCLLSDQGCMSLWNPSMFGFITASLSMTNHAHIACMPEAALARGPDDFQQQFTHVFLARYA